MREIIRQICSILLLLVLLCNVIPASIFASDLSEEPSLSATNDLISTQAGSSPESVEVLGEDLSKRSELYVTWTYTWEQGRQLAKMQSSSVTWNFTYDADDPRLIRLLNFLAYSYSESLDTYRFGYVEKRKSMVI